MLHENNITGNCILNEIKVVGSQEISNHRETFLNCVSNYD